MVCSNSTVVSEIQFISLHHDLHTIKGAAMYFTIYGSGMTICDNFVTTDNYCRLRDHVLNDNTATKVSMTGPEGYGNSTAVLSLTTALKTKENLCLYLTTNILKNYLIYPCFVIKCITS